MSVGGISPIMSDNFACFSCSETCSRSWSTGGTKWRRSTMLTSALRPCHCLLLKSNETVIPPFGTTTLYILLKLQDLFKKICRFLQVVFREKQIFIFIIDLFSSVVLFWRAAFLFWHSIFPSGFSSAVAQPTMQKATFHNLARVFWQLLVGSWIASQKSLVIGWLQ